MMHNNNNDNKSDTTTTVVALCQMTCCFKMTTVSSTSTSTSNVRVDAWPDRDNNNKDTAIGGGGGAAEGRRRRRCTEPVVVHSTKRRLGKIALAIPLSSSTTSQVKQQHVSYNFALERPWQNNNVTVSSTNTTATTTDNEGKYSCAGGGGDDSVRRIIHGMTQYATRHGDFANAVRVCVHNTQLAKVRNMWTRSNMNPVSVLFRQQQSSCILYDDANSDASSSVTCGGVDKCLVAMFYGGHMDHHSGRANTSSSGGGGGGCHSISYDYILPFDRPDERIPPYSAIVLSVNMFQIMRIIHVLCTIVVVATNNQQQQQQQQQSGCNNNNNNNISNRNIFERYTTASDSSSSSSSSLSFLDQVAIPALCAILDHNDSNSDDDNNDDDYNRAIGEFRALFAPSSFQQVHENVRDMLMANFPNDPHVRSSSTIINYSKKKQQRVKGQQRLMTDFIKSPLYSSSSVAAAAATTTTNTQQQQQQQQAPQMPVVSPIITMPTVKYCTPLPPPSPQSPPIADVSMRDSPAVSTEIRGPSQKNTIPTDMATICGSSNSGGAPASVPTMQTLRGFPCSPSSRQIPTTTTTTRSTDAEFAYFKQRSEAIMTASNVFMHNCLIPVIFPTDSSSSSFLLTNNLKLAAAASKAGGGSGCAIILQELMDQHNCILTNNHRHNK